MSKDKRLIKEYKVLNGSKATHIEVDLTYQLGGWNYFTGVKEPRGLYLGCSPIEKGDGWRGFVAFSGVKVLVHEMKRFNAKTINEFEVDQNDVVKMVAHVLVKNNLEIDSE